MNSCPETEKIKCYRAGTMAAGAAERFRMHLESCPACRQELSIEAAIDLELAREFSGPDIEGSVLRVLGLPEPSRPFEWLRGSIRYLILAVLLTGFGLLITRFLARRPGPRINFLWLSDWLNSLFGYAYAHPALMIGIGGAVCVASMLYTLSRLKLIRWVF